MAETEWSVEGILCSPLLWGFICVVTTAIAISGRLDVNVAKWILVVAWLMAAFSIYRFGPVLRQPFVPRILLMMVSAGIVGLALYYLAGWMSQSITEENVESYARQWGAAMERFRIEPMPPSQKSYFRYAIFLEGDGREVVQVKRTKDYPRFLTFEAALPFGNDATSAFNNLSEEQKSAFQLKFKAEIARATRFEWVCDSSFSSFHIRQRIPIQGINEDSFTEAASKIITEAHSVVNVMLPLFVSILPTTVTVQHEDVTPDNVEAYIHQCAKDCTTATLDKLPEHPGWLFGYSLSFADKNPNCILRTKQAPNVLIFTVGIPLQFARGVYDTLATKDRSRFIEELKSYWKNNYIQASLREPFEDVTITRGVVITNLDHDLFLTTVKRIHFEAVLVTNSIETALEQYLSQAPKPSRYDYQKLTKDYVREIEATLVLINQMNVHIDAVNKDAESVTLMSEIEALFKETGHVVARDRVTDVKENPANTTIAVYLTANPPLELTVAVNMIALRLYRHISYKQSLSGDTLQLVIGAS